MKQVNNIKKERGVLHGKEDDKERVFQRNQGYS